MTIGPDLEEVLNEVGVAVSIHRGSTLVGNEFLDYEINRQVTKPFVREYFLEAFLSYDTDLLAGDYITITADGRKFMTMNRTPELFENEVIKYDVVMYKTNVTIDIKRMGTPTRDPDTLKRINVWDTVVSGVDVLLTERLYGTSLQTAGGLNELIEFELAEDQLYIPALYDIRSQDRVVVSADEVYKVNFVEDRKFDNVNLCLVGEDNR